MIISRTPLRISFFGGGTDFPEFYRREGGAVLSSAVDRYIHVVVKRRFDDKIRLGYSTTELVDSVPQIRHELVRESLRLTGISKGLEIATLADIPSSGSGMGSSSAVTVGLLHALKTYQGRDIGPETLAQMACRIEIGILCKPIGVQDQYIAAFGGHRFIEFHPNGEVSVRAVGMEEGPRRRLSANLMLFFTNTTRKAESVLHEQARNINDRLDVLRELRRLAYVGLEYLEQGAVDKFGLLLDDAWRLKKQLASNISSQSIDNMYSAAIQAGALGGKIAGAGGGGFLLLYCPVERQQRVRDALNPLPELPIQLESSGATIVYSAPDALPLVHGPQLDRDVTSAWAV